MIIYNKTLDNKARLAQHRSTYKIFDLTRRYQKHFVVVRVFAFLKNRTFYHELFQTHTLLLHLYSTVLFILLCLSAFRSVYHIFITCGFIRSKHPTDCFIFLCEALATRFSSLMYLKRTFPLSSTQCVENSHIIA